MPVEIQEEAEGKIFAIRLSEKLTKQDYEHFVPETERRMKQHGKLRMLVEMHDFHGWSLGALWEDTRATVRYLDAAQRDDAVAWLNEGVHQTA